MQGIQNADVSLWRKSTYSNGDQGNCVEVRDDLPGLVPIRDSKDPSIGQLLIGATPWTALTNALRN
ncbi:DUF397 domain-containing protein [Embleya sp. NBC_00888]|uniref:DUF397 domain-containing protein n=1 Tax=Embleya sp. NBC_00888 TaxID=2975960 RepID=UPI00386BA960|nr:DUF397 domain-containing protein [Embleya sp. NBC_00888]